jgi:aldehyde dehydrogenase (NAD+)/betaine-aldehyde dehydrogenase
MLSIFQQYINGRFDNGSETFESENPATGAPWATMPAATEHDVERAVQAAHAALSDPAWAKLTATQRGKLLIRLGDLLAANAQHLALTETTDTGKIIRETSAQIAYIAEYFRYFGGAADKLEGAVLPIDKPDMEVSTRREPIGVVAAIVPWNSQLFLAAVKLGPALAAGCTVVLKASEEAPAPLLEFAKLIDEAGFPAGVVNVLTGFGEPCGRALTSHRLVSRIAFTGGPETARHIVRNSAANLAATTLELGGKSPVVVFDDADIGGTVNAVVAGIFGASGQSCVAGSRLIVHAKIRDAFLDALVAKARQIRIGTPDDPATEMGPLATSRQLEKIEQIVAASRAAGGVVLTGGQRPASMQAGNYYEPTIIDCPNPDVPSVQTELFGPVLSVLGFETEEEAVRLANSTEYGLASGVFTRDLSRAHRMMKAIRAGVVWVNTYRAISPTAPFGGYGESGYGREGGIESMLEYTRTKTVWIRTSDEPIADPFVMR